MMTEIMQQQLMADYLKAKSQHQLWSPLWQECYDYALPQRSNMAAGQLSANRRFERIYDGTALDAVDQLASLLLGNLTPPMTGWFGLKAGTDLMPQEATALQPHLEKATRILQSHFDQSNFVVELHQCLLDLVVAGTASLLFEENDPGSLSAFRFAAQPLWNVALAAGPDSSRLEITYRAMTLPDSEKATPVIEATYPDADNKGYWVSILNTESGEMLSHKKMVSSPFINFRWMKSPDDVYGRSPVMKALPDIKTANKVVELILKNASISVTGIWQAEDDGVLNLSNIELVPGAIIPKAIGSKGLTPLEMPSRFDVSQLVLEDLRSRIRHALLADRLPQLADQVRRTATEIAERSNEMALLLGATFGRLQVELLNPLIKRAYEILRRRGEIPDLPLDGRIVTIDHRSPLARAQCSRHVQTTLDWMQAVRLLGPEVEQQVDKSALLDYLSEMLRIPSFRKEQNQPAKPSPVSTSSPLSNTTTGE